MKHTNKPMHTPRTEKEVGAAIQSISDKCWNAFDASPNEFTSLQSTVFEAAPDLLAALERVLEALPCNLNLEGEQLRSDIKTAIAKAKGA